MLAIKREISLINGHYCSPAGLLAKLAYLLAVGFVYNTAISMLSVVTRCTADGLGTSTFAAGWASSASWSANSAPKKLATAKSDQ